MKSISPPAIINNGIAVYFPGTSNNLSNYLQLQIFYSKDNPLFSWVACDNVQRQIWTKNQEYGSGGVLFLYQLNSDIPLGFYTIRAKLFSTESQTKEGQFFIGITSPTPNLIIGLPYSVYPSIDLA
jgi:hypothetical protein